ncbi:hypothetical protein GGI21_003391 [Coemansia aciculifera]|nr:hypothetical protein GGI21_003391 [Coemansia aciculifera]
MLINWSGNRVPYPKDARFRAKDSVRRLSFGFWTPFQQEMWKVFITQDVGPCYLDAVFGFEKSGFLMWTLFFEYGGMTVPVSFLITTSVTIRLLSDWLAEIAMAGPSDLPKRTMYVNTMKAYDFVVSVFSDWDVRYAKYYITQELRQLVLRSDAYGKEVVEHVRVVNTQFAGAFRALRIVEGLAVRMKYLFTKSEDWMPKNKAEVSLFEHSSGAISRWRYLLWMTMLGHSTVQRIDLVLYYVHAVILPGVEGAYTRFVDRSSAHELVPFSMDEMEYGGSPSHETRRKRHLGGSLVCLTEDNEPLLKVIVDLELQVCFCEMFRVNKICHHLVYCLPSAVHYPELPRVLQEIPTA